MLAKVISHAPLGIDGEIIFVEVDLRKGIPGMDIVGLPDGAVKEARERVRVAIKNSGLEFPARRILVNLAPAGIKKIGAGYDLPIAIAILAASGQLPLYGIQNSMILGELNLSGEVKPAHGVLSAIGAGIKQGIETFLVPEANLREALLPGAGKIFGIKSLIEASDICKALTDGDLDLYTPGNIVPLPVEQESRGDMADIKGHWTLKRAMEVAAAGRHHLFLFGPPGSGKTMAARRLPTILPNLSRDESLLVTQIHSIAGVLPLNRGLIQSPPFRMPHHTASKEGVIGGGRIPRPGEVSLAHEGILFLDETPEYKRSLLQALREPVEEGYVTISRAAKTLRFPASFQLVMAANPCPCGNLGHKERVCMCSTNEIYRYWKQIGGALLDRIDMRIPVKPSSEVLNSTAEESGGTDLVECSRTVKRRVENAIKIQRERYEGLPFSRNSRINPASLDIFCALDSKGRQTLKKAVEKLYLSSRACHSILKIARTIADLEGRSGIEEDHLLEAVHYRRYGDKDFFWNFQ